MRTFATRLLVLFTMGIMPVDAMAQRGGIAGGIGVNVGPNGPTLSGFGNVDLQKTTEFWADSQIQTILPQMELRVDQIIELCGLSEEEANRIRLAVKGVVSKRTAAASRQIEEFVYSSGLAEPPSDFERGPEVMQHDQLVFFSAHPVGDGVVALGADFKLAITEHPLWINTIEKTLTASQFEKYRQFRMDHSRKLLHLAIDYWVASLESDVVLSPQQTDAVTVFIRNELDKLVTMEYPASMRQATETVEKAFAGNSDSLGNLLTEKQTALRRMRLVQPAGPKASWGTAPNR